VTLAINADRGAHHLVEREPLLGKHILGRQGDLQTRICVLIRTGRPGGHEEVRHKSQRETGTGAEEAEEADDVHLSLYGRWPPQDPPGTWR